MNASLESDVSRLESILEGYRAIVTRMGRFGITEESFCADDAFQEMLLFPLFQIGEHANHLSEEFVAADVAVPWRKVIGMRHIIVHNYAKVDPLWVWRILETDLVDMGKHVEAVLPALGDLLEQGGADDCYGETLRRCLSAL